MVGSVASGVSELRVILPQRQRMSDHLVLPEIQPSGKQRYRLLDMFATELL